MSSKRLFSNRSKSLSPTAQLLRSSRLFSLPPPLPRPSNEVITISGASRSSDTATTPYPTHQAIATPQSSLSRGDWGLKRPLPLRSTTRTSTPTFRVSALDTLEHITEFESAADHTQTLRKWQELDLPVSTRAVERRNGVSPTAESRGAGRSVFEAAYDITDPDAVPSAPSLAQVSPVEHRWKFTGPWLAGMTEGEFKRYVEKEIGSRKAEFRKFLKGRLQERKLQRIREEYMGEGQDMENLVKMSKLSDQEFADRIKKLRGEAQIQGELNTIIRDFLDLAYMADVSSSAGSTSHDRFIGASGAAETGPLSTHPSAGLSYLRSNATLQNHPVLGPQAHKTPVRARVLRTRKGTGDKAIIGVAGIVASDFMQGGFLYADGRGEGEEPGLAKLDYTTEGGTKIWVEPTHAHIDPQGHIRLETTRPNSKAVDISQGRATPTGSQIPKITSRGRFDAQLDEPRQPSARFGLGLPNSPISNRRPQFTGYADGGSSANAMLNTLRRT